MEAFFRQVDRNRYRASASTTGPWSESHQHAGPPSALVAGRLQDLLGAHHPVVRVYVEVTRPIPIEVLRLETRLRRDGRTAKFASASLYDEADQLVMSAEALGIAKVELSVDAPRPPMDEASPHDASAIPFPVFPNPHGYAEATEIRIARGEIDSGDVMVWLRTRASIIEGRSPTPLERVMVAADSGNGVSAAVDPREMTFINPDLTVALHRHPEGEWIGLAARTDLGPGGIGVADARLYDERGPVGRGVQTLVIRRRS